MLVSPKLLMQQLLIVTVALIAISNQQQPPSVARPVAPPPAAVAPPAPAPTSPPISAPKPRPVADMPMDEESRFPFMGSRRQSIVRNILRGKTEAVKTLLRGVKDIAGLKIRGVIEPIRFSAVSVKNLTRSNINLGRDVYDAVRNALRDTMVNLRSGRPVIRSPDRQFDNLKESPNNAAADDGEGKVITMVDHMSKCNITLKVLSCENLGEDKDANDDDDDDTNLCLVELDINDCEDMDLPMDKPTSPQQPPKPQASKFETLDVESSNDGSTEHSARIQKRSAPMKTKVSPRFVSRCNTIKPKFHRAPLPLSLNRKSSF